MICELPECLVARSVLSGTLCRLITRSEGVCDGTEEEIQIHLCHVCQESVCKDGHRLDTGELNHVQKR